MGPIGDCNDNALIEALWSRMQIELLDTHRWTTRVELANAIFGYSEIFHNPTGATRSRHADTNRIRTLDTNTTPVASTPVKAA
jgi:putative transposase